MKKLLLTCLMGGLCLLGHAQTAQVADSPPETDLVDYSGLPAGNRIADFSVNDLKVGFPRQEGESSSASVGEAAPVVIYGEIMGQLPEKEIYLYTWPRFTGRGFTYEESEKLNIELDAPEFFRGALPSVLNTFNVSAPSLESSFYLSIRTDSEFLLPTFLVSPGDSVMIRWDRNNNSIYFSGPQGAKFDLQYQLHRLAGNSEFTTKQNILVTDREEFLKKDGNKEKQENASSQFGRHLFIIEKGEEQLTDLEFRVADSTFKTAVDRLCDAYFGDLAPELIQMYKADAVGKRYAVIARKALSMIRSDGKWLDNPETLKRLQQLVAILWEVSDSLQDTHEYNVSGSLELWFDLTEATSALAQTEFFDWIMALEDSYSKEVLLEAYILRKGKWLNDFDQKIAMVHQNVKNDVTQQNIESIMNARTSGTLITSAALPSLDSGYKSLDGMKGKMVLVEFWVSGCGSCYFFYNNVMKGLQEHFAGDDRLRLVSVSVDSEKERWKGNAGKFYSEDGINLLAESSQHPVLKQLGINSFPSFVLLGKNAEIIKTTGFPDPDVDEWIRLIEQGLANEFGHQYSTGL